MQPLRCMALGTLVLGAGCAPSPNDSAPPAEPNSCTLQELAVTWSGIDPANPSTRNYLVFLLPKAGDWNTGAITGDANGSDGAYFSFFYQSAQPPARPSGLSIVSLTVAYAPVEVTSTSVVALGSALALNFSGSESFVDAVTGVSVLTTAGTFAGVWGTSSVFQSSAEAGRVNVAYGSSDFELTAAGADCSF